MRIPRCRVNRKCSFSIEIAYIDHAAEAKFNKAHNTSGITYELGFAFSPGCIMS
jgi:hypothetical protein